MAIVHVETKDEFNTQVVEEAEKLVIVDFWATWCGPCKQLSPIFEKVSDEMDDVKFVKVEVDKADELAQKFNVMSIPTLILVKEGKVLDTKTGALDEDALKAFINAQK